MYRYNKMLRMFESVEKATTVDGVLQEVTSTMSLGHNLWAYAYMRYLYNKNMNLRPILLLKCQ